MASQDSAGASRGAESLHNEDRFLVKDKLGLYLVCDGQSDRPAGERASAIAADSLEHFLTSPDSTHAIENHSITLQVVEAAIEYALSQVVIAAQENAELEGMASTMTLLIVQQGRGYIGHVGDSRAYLVRRDRCDQLTADQEWTESEYDASSSLGEGTAISPPKPAPRADVDIQVETFSVELESGDTFILCTDGAEDEMEDREFVRSIGDASPAMIASRLVSRSARLRPGHDATCVVFRVHDDHEHAWVTASGEPQWLEGVQSVAHDHGREEASAPGSSGEKPRFNPTYVGRGKRPTSGDGNEPRGRRSGIEFS